ncbi:hypothetical protein ACJJTC_014740 [Scirpophaga incertulas]
MATLIRTELEIYGPVLNLNDTNSVLCYDTNIRTSVTFGRSAQDLYFNTLKNPDKEKLEDIVEIFENYFKPKNNEIINTFHFNQRKQQDGENFDAFYSDLRKIAQNCNFESFFERMLRDRIIHGIQDRHVQQKLLEKKELTLEQTVDICRTSELSKEHVKIITEQQTSLHDVDAVQAKQPAFQHNITKAKYNQINKNVITYICKKCNTQHGPRNCPAFGKTCSFCKIKNHFAVGCKLKNRVLSLNVNKLDESPVDL